MEEDNMAIPGKSRSKGPKSQVYQKSDKVNEMEYLRVDSILLNKWRQIAEHILNCDDEHEALAYDALLREIDRLNTGKTTPKHVRNFLNQEGRKHPAILKAVRELSIEKMLKELEDILI